MPAPYTAFTYGDPALSAPTITRSAVSLVNGLLLGFSSIVLPTASALKGGTNGAAYSETISASGGQSPYSFAVTSGTIPTGTTLNTATGVISGTPTATGTFTFNITATDNSGMQGTSTFTIVISPTSSSGGGSYVFVA